jgi:SET domain-containing protein
MENKNLVVKKSSIEGLGVFAGKDFVIGEKICVFNGRHASIQDMRDEFKFGETRISCDGFQISETEYLMLDSPYIYMNHSCLPNASFRGVGELIAIKPILMGEEIFYDYSAAEWTPQEYIEYDHSEWPMHCLCGATTCRKLIACFPYIPKDLRKTYIESGILLDHIKEKLKKSPSEQRCFVCEEALGHGIILS